MKKLGSALLLLLLLHCAEAQTWSEWFRQKKTKIKYLVEQIAALKAYGDIAWKGYGRAKEGLTNIGGVKGSDLAMHSEYFASLGSVNPVVKNDSKVGRIISLQVRILTLYQRQRKLIQGSGQFTADDATHVDNVLTRLLAGCADIVTELITVTSDHSSRMKDNERIARIDALYADLQDRYAFLKSFAAETSVLSLQRMRDGNDSKTARALFGVE